MPSVCHKHHEAVAFGIFQCDPRKRELRAHGAAVELQSRTLDILLYLVEARDCIVTRKEMMAAIWPGQTVSDSRLTVQLSLLRRALAVHDTRELIITVPGKGYRFVGEVTADEVVAAPLPASPEISPPAAPADSQAALYFWQQWRVAVFLCTTAVLAAMLLRLDESGRAKISLPALVKVKVRPEEVRIDPGGYAPIDYIFTVDSPADVQVETEDFQFQLPHSGEPVGFVMKDGRIFGGSFPIKGGTTAVYKNHIFLPREVASLGRARGGGLVLLKHVFHLRTARGEAVSVPAVLMIDVGDVAWVR